MKKDEERPGCVAHKLREVYHCCESQFVTTRFEKHAESARAVNGRRCSHMWGGEDFLALWRASLTQNRRRSDQFGWDQLLKGANMKSYECL